MKLETLEFLQSLVSQVQLAAGAEDFEQTANKVVDAKKELAAEIDDLRKK